MNVNVKCFASLSVTGECDYMESSVQEINADDSVKTLVDRLGMPAEKVEIVFVNGRKSDLNAKLSDGDRVGLFPAVGGM